MKRLIVHVVPPPDAGRNEPVIQIEGVYFPGTGYMLNYVNEECTEYYTAYSEQEAIYKRFSRNGGSSSIEWIDSPA